ncbi:phage tail tape measure protein [Castellaniella caeni]
MRDLDSAIKNAVRQGGGSRDQAAETLDNLLASGALSHSSAVNLLPTLQKASTATGASGTELADVAIRGMQTFGIKESEIPQMLDMAVKAGQGGGFELKDMARWLPKMMAMAKTSGMSGLQDFGTLVAAAQASMITGGTADAAGNNLANLLAKINSRDTANQAAKIEMAPGKSIDLAGTLSKAAGEGKNSLDAFVGIVDQVVAGNKEYQALQQKIAKLDPKADQGERAALMEKQSAILQGSAVGQLIQDQQALLALVGYMGNRDYVKGIKKDFGNGVDAIGVGFDVMASTGEFKVQQGTNAWQASEFEVFKPLIDQLGNLTSKTAELAAEYPGMANGVVAVTTALTALAAVSLSGKVVNMMRGAGAAGAVVAAEQTAAKAAARATTGGGSSLMRQAAGKVGGVVGKVGVAPFLIAGSAAYDAYQVQNNAALSGSQKTDAMIDIGARAGGGLTGMYAGAAAGAAVTGPFAPFGALVGGGLGYMGGDYLGGHLAQYLQQLRNVPTPAEQQAAMAAAPNAATLGVTPEQFRDAIIAGNRETKDVPQKIDLNVTVDVQNGNIVAEVNRVNERESWRH